MYDRARAQAEAILAGPMVDPPPEATVAAVDEFPAAADAELREG
jgi:hypothetical protein